MSVTIKKAWFKPYNYLVSIDGNVYHVKQLGVTSRNLVTVNSKYIWAIKTGTQQGLQYRTLKTHLVPLQEFLTYENPVIVFKQRPYKLLKYINESDIVDISSEDQVHGIPFYTNLTAFIQSLKKKEQE